MTVVLDVLSLIFGIVIAMHYIKGLIIVFTLLSFRQSVEPESSDVALKSLDAGLRTSGMTEKEYKL